MATFTSRVEGKLLNGIELPYAEAEALMREDGRIFFEAPSIAPKGFVDFNAGMTIFPLIGADGNITDSVIVYEVIEPYRIGNQTIFPKLDANGGYSGKFYSYPADAVDGRGDVDESRQVERTQAEYEKENGPLGTMPLKVGVGDFRAY